MSGDLRGEVKVSVDGTEWSLVMDMNALCDFEDETGIAPLSFLGQLDEGAEVKISHLRTLIHCMVRQKHPEATKKEAGRILSFGADGWKRALKAAFPEEIDGDGSGDADVSGEPQAATD